MEKYAECLSVNVTSFKRVIEGEASTNIPNMQS